jgi:hypothetical protein
MVFAFAGEARPLAGRAAELRGLAELIGGAARGRFRALVVSGEAGVGKTALIREACRRAGEDVEVRWARCLPLTSFNAPLLPLRPASPEWTGAGPAEFDAWLETVSRRRPTVLVVDDLHWADQSSLDVLMYVAAGPADRRLALLVTLRSSEVGPQHPVRSWLSDVRRLPGVDQLHLERLDRPATADQLADLLGEAPHQHLVDEVFARTRGNAYLTALLARGLPPGAAHLPADLPADLRDAVSRRWQGLPPPGRQLIRLLALAGRPQQPRMLSAAAARAGIRHPVPPLLRQAVEAGVVEPAGDGGYWFVHPLLAEVLADDLDPEDRRAAHAVLAGLLEPVGESGVERLVELADHHFHAGHTEAAYRWALRASRAAEQAGGHAECLRLLRRALELRPAGTARIELLTGIRDAAERAGEQAHELAAIEDLIPLVDPGKEPLFAAELLVRRMMLNITTGRRFADLSDVRTAVRYTADQPHSMQHAWAMAELAHAELWHGEPSGLERVAEAVRLARACGSAKALAYALAAQALARFLSGRGGGVAEAREAQAAAAEAGDFWAFTHAALLGANCRDDFACPEVLEHLRRIGAELTSLGCPHTYLARVYAGEATGLLLYGDWRRCLDRLRVALGSNPGPMPDVEARLTAALLACWQGRLPEARSHLTRAGEVFTELAYFPQFHFHAVRAELALAAGDSEAAFTAASDGAQGRVPPIMAERLLPLAARALADQAQRLGDERADPAPALTRLDDLRRRYPRVLRDGGPTRTIGS